MLNNNSGALLHVKQEALNTNAAGDGRKLTNSF